MKHARHLRFLLVTGLLVLTGVIAVLGQGLFPRTMYAAASSTHTKAGTPAKHAYSNYTLNINNLDPNLSQDFISNAQNVFDYSYPLLVNRFGNSSTPTTVTLTIDPSASGVAWTSGSEVTIASTYWTQNPSDNAWFTHELTHVVQQYTNSDAPGWFVEGMADYARYYYAPDWAEPSWWHIPGPPSPDETGPSAYGPGARFLIWLSQRKDSTIVDQLNTAAQNGEAFLPLFEQLAGGTVDEVWSQYVADPAITL